MRFAGQFRGFCRGALAGCLLGACSFAGGAPGSDDGVRGIDAPTCAWLFTPKHVADPCALASSEQAVLNDAVINGDDPGFDTITNADEIETAQWVVGSLEINGTVQVVGARPLQIVSLSTISIVGVLEVGGALVTNAAGANDPVLCADGAGSPGEDDNNGAAGGGGGGFGQPGARGENGDVDEGDSIGGDGGESASVSFRGGCPGGRGGDADAGTGGAGGRGGGAVHLVARQAITLADDAFISAGGGGGAPGVNRSDAAGGGGGSGGYVGIEAMTIELGDTSFIGSNGGGGGGGTSTSDNGETAGAAGNPSAIPAAGGDGARSNGDDGGGDGGDGGAIGAPALEPDSNPVGASGGGGGGVGIIVVGTSGAAPNLARFSPSFTSFDLQLR